MLHLNKMDITFNGKRALVTGGGRGMGEAVALKLVELGAQVFVVDIVKENLEQLKSKAPAIETRLLDVSDWEATRQCVTELCPIDLLENNAGILRYRSVIESTKEDIDSTMGVNFKAMFNISQVIAADIISRGSSGAIVNFSSVSGARAASMYSVYSASKAAVEMLTKSLAVELAPYQIRANCVAPGPIMTDMGKEVIANAGGDSVPIIRTIPAGEFPEIDDVVYLLSDKSKMISGATLPIDVAKLAAL